MRALFLFLLCLAVASATLSNSFTAILGNVSIAAPPGSNDVNYFLSSLGLSFINATNFQLALTGTVKTKGYDLEAAPTTCYGSYVFASPDDISFIYDLSPSSVICTQQTTLKFGFCPWGCSKFAGTYVPFFDSIDAPKFMAITPGPDTPGVTWGGLPYNIKLSCNTTSCGSASNLIPPAPLPANSSVQVCRWRDFVCL